MAIKYKREGVQKSGSNADNKYVVRRGLFGNNPRRRLMVIYLGLSVMWISLLAFHFLSGSRMNRWLPERMGDGQITEKYIEDEGGESEQYVVHVQVSVPPAAPTEAEYVVPDAADRARLVGELELGDDVETDIASWSSVSPGTAVRVSYQINMQRSKIIIRSLYTMDVAPPSDAGAPVEESIDE